MLADDNFFWVCLFKSRCHVNVDLIFALGFSGILSCNFCSFLYSIWFGVYDHLLIEDTIDINECTDLVSLFIQAGKLSYNEIGFFDNQRIVLSLGYKTNGQCVFSGW